MIFSKPVFQLWPEVPDKTLYWPSSAVSQSADGVALNLFAQFPNHINLLWLRVALGEPPHHCVHPVNIASLAIALTTSVCLFMTMSAAVPRPVCLATKSSKSIKTSSQTALGMRGVELPPGMTHSRLSQPPITPPQWRSISSFRGMLISSSTVQGLFTWPEMLTAWSRSSWCGPCWRTSLLPSCRWSEPRRQSRRWSQWWDSRRHRRQRGMGASGGACPAYPPGSQSRRSPLRRCRRQHHGAQRGRSHSQSHRRWLPRSQRRRPP